MDALIEKKTLAIEHLLGITSALLREIDSGDLDQLERGLSQRSRVFSELEKLDHNFVGKPTDRDESWMRQLQQLQEMDRDLKERMENQLKDIQRSLRREQEAKAILIKTEMADARGTKLKTKA